MSIAAPTHPWLNVAPVRVTVEQYTAFRRDGYLVVRGLVLPEHVAELEAHCNDLIEGRVDLTEIAHLGANTPADRLAVIHRLHQGHTKLELWERYLLYPRLLDVLEVLIGPDVAAMQTMLFTKAPGSNGQGFHQDSHYIPTFPDTLIGAWIAIEAADRENGCLWVCPGSNHEPIYPPKQGWGYGDVKIDDIPRVSNVGGHSNDDEDPLNTLKPIAARYRDVEIPVEVQPGDVIFFGGHIFHRSFRNRSENRFRRSLVNHYSNARSFTTWGGGNARHILARGNTHLEFALPKFGTPCAALDPKPSVSDTGEVPEMMMATPEGEMMAQVPVEEEHEH
ncbi:MAG: phytanoyl-CoA dioxygenase family protein [Fimbriimonas sp.]